MAASRASPSLKNSFVQQSLPAASSPIPQLSKTSLPQKDLDTCQSTESSSARSTPHKPHQKPLPFWEPQPKSFANQPASLMSPWDCWDLPGKIHAAVSSALSKY